MFYYIPWAIFIFIGLVASIALLIWADHSGQLADQGRARYLPLMESEFRTQAKNQGRSAKEPYALLALLVGTGAVFLVTLLFIILERKAG